MLAVLFGGKSACPEFAPFGDVVQIEGVTTRQEVHPVGFTVVYVVVPMEDGMVRGVRVFGTREAAVRAEQAWLRQSGLTEEKARERASDWGTGIAVWECVMPEEQAQPRSDVG